MTQHVPPWLCHVKMPIFCLLHNLRLCFDVAVAARGSAARQRGVWLSEGWRLQESGVRVCALTEMMGSGANRPPE